MPQSHKAYSKRHAVDLHPTPESIAAARRAQFLERAQVYAETGLLLDDDGQMLRMVNTVYAAVNGPRGEKR